MYFYHDKSYYTNEWMGVWRVCTAEVGICTRREETEWVDHTLMNGCMVGAIERARGSRQELGG